MGGFKTPHEKTPRQRTRFARILCAKRTASFFPSARACACANPLANQIVSSVSLSLFACAFLAGASYRDRHRLFLFSLSCNSCLSVSPRHDLTPLPQNLVQPPDTHLRYRPQQLLRISILALLNLRASAVRQHTPPLPPRPKSHAPTLNHA